MPVPAAQRNDAADATTSAADTVFFGILNGLEQQRFVPGQRLVEVDLAAQFGVGRNSVREALQRSVAEGVAETVRHKGAVIRALTVEDTMDVLDVAERMTGLLARSAARAVAAGAPTQPLSRALQELRSAAREQDADAFARARRGFYRALLDTSGSRELRRLFPSIHMPIVYAQHRLASLHKLRVRDYPVIGKAVMAGDAEAAEDAAMGHVRKVRGEILRAVSLGRG
jgi:DNA-binding GntR family transcriptional regulator